MPGIQNYTDLQATVLDWLVRPDLAGAVVQTFIANAEARFRRELKRWFKSYLSFVGVTGDLVLDADVVDRVVGVAMNDGAGGLYNHPLEHLTRDDYHRLMGSNSTTRQPACAVFVDYDQQDRSTTLRFYPPASASASIANLRVDIIRKLPSLSSDIASNALLVEAPDLYYKAALVDAEPYLQHDERLPVWKDQVDEGIASLELQAADRLAAGMPRHIILPVVFG